MSLGKLALGSALIYGLVLASHAIRFRFGLAFYHALLGALTAMMVWVTDSGLAVQAGGITFLVGSTAFFTAILLGVFVLYVFDGPPAARTAILVVVGASALTVLVEACLHLLPPWGAAPGMVFFPWPDPRINGASILATLVDLFFLAMAWEFLNQERGRLPLGLRVLVTLLGVMELDVVLFVTGAFGGQSDWLSILQGHLTSRFLVSLLAAPLVWAYLRWQSQRGMPLERRPVMAILHRMNQIERELSGARQEIERRKKVEEEKEELIKALREAQSDLRRLSFLDPLTQVANRRLFDELLGVEFARSRREGAPLSLIMADLDFFKKYNDTYGHQQGDVCLKLVAAKLKEMLHRPGDRVARFGGEEFVVLLPGTDLEGGRQVAEGLRRQVAALGLEHESSPISSVVTISLGVASTKGAEYPDADSLVAAADQALYRAKNAGRDRVHTSPPSLEPEDHS